MREASGQQATTTGLHLETDEAIIQGLQDWERRGGGHPTRIPVNPWPRKSGYTEAYCLEIIVQDGSFERSVLLKVCPSGETEASNHSKAWLDSPHYARRHLVEQPYQPWPLKDGRMLTFQAFAGDDYRACFSMADCDSNDLEIAIPRIVHSLITEWNSDQRTHKVFEHETEYLAAETGVSRAEILETFGDTPLESCQWFVRPGMRRILPNPLALLRGEHQGHDGPLEIIAGHAHRDLHLENVVVKMDERKEKLQDYWLIDLASYESSWSLTSDPVRLLLSAFAHHLPRTPAHEHSKLLRAVVSHNPSSWSHHSLARSMTLSCQQLQRAATRSRQGYPGSI